MESNIVLDVIYSDISISKLIQSHNSINNDLCSILSQISDELKNQPSPDHDTENQNTNIHLSDLQIGDIVRVSYYPDSQKYVEYYDEQKFDGKCLFVDVPNDNAFFEVINQNDQNDQAGLIRTFKSLEREGCHYFGMARSYYYSIQLLKN